LAGSSPIPKRANELVIELLSYFFFFLAFFFAGFFFVAFFFVFFLAMICHLLLADLNPFIFWLTSQY
jgi:hypothetical protein